MAAKEQAQGIDLPSDATNLLKQLNGGRLDFVARYYREPMSSWPALTAREAQLLSALNLNIVAIWEPRLPEPTRYSYPSGYRDALAAQRQAKAVGQPSGSAIYFAIDFDARNDVLRSVDQYFRGIAAGLAEAGRGQPEYKVGVYGSGAVCAAVRQAGLAQYAWISNARAWAGASYEDWNIRQGARLAHLSFNHDGDTARGDYGGFRLVAPRGGAEDDLAEAASKRRKAAGTPSL